MDSITVISLASNVIFFIDFGTTLIRGAKKVQDAGALEENDTLDSVACQMQTFVAKLLAPDQANLTGTDLGLAELAAKCRDVASDLSGLLEKIRAKDPASKRQAVWSVIKNLKYDEEKKSLEARLGSCRSQLEIQLNYLARRTGQDFKNILQASESSSRRLEEVWGSVTHLRNVIDAAGFDDVARGQMQQLYRIPEDVADVVAQERILNGVKFDGINALNERHDAICEAHSKTFEWLVSEAEENNKPVEIFQRQFLSALSHLGSNPLLTDDGGELITDEDDILAEFGDWRKYHDVRMESRPNGLVGDSDLSNDLKERRSARNLFQEWLSSGEGIFHFSGKLGAGKSTLMKLMCSHEHVQSLLEAWARTYNRKLVFAKHFFFNVGTGHQKSLPGM
ncbi:hypothetical protein LZ31DRAFT_604549 [Colletotrichum somersetense]|nr:hypothetical protein LZ31DRAFT_604549 [Colletotrichum somersetense]